MEIYFLQFNDARPVGPGAHAAFVRAWVKAENETEAVAVARAALRARGLGVETPDAAAATTRTDYFPPCPGLEAFQRAERDGACYVIEPTEER